MFFGLCKNARPHVLDMRMIFAVRYFRVCRFMSLCCTWKHLFTCNTVPKFVGQSDNSRQSVSSGRDSH